MRTVALAAIVVFGPALARGQDTAIVINPESSATAPHELPRTVAEEAVAFFNAATTTRLVGRTTLPHGNEWRGNVAVRNGSVSLAGRIAGSLLVIDGEVVLDSTGEVTGSITVIGGSIARAPQARVGGEVRVYREPLAYKAKGDEIALVSQRPRLPFLSARKTWTGADTRSSLTIATGGTFNRVEGLPIVLGPEFAWRLSETVGLRVDALGIVRSVGDLGDTPGDLGYIVRTEVRAGGGHTGVGIGARAYSVVAPVEDAGLTSAEVGWAAFLVQRDYRDYYFNRGVRGRVFASPAEPITLSLDLSYDWQTSVSAADPWSLFRNESWRANGPIDAGHYTTLGGTVTVDTRNDAEQPTAGWLIEGRIAASWAPDVEPQPLPASVRAPIPTDGSYQFNRLSLDVRRYTRVSPAGRVNLRLLMGGWLGGDPLPLQQRVSIGGPALLSGYTFRHSACSADITDAAFAGTQLAACDRLILTQIEYRGHLALHWFYGKARPEDESSKKSLWSLQGPDFVVFGDAGQAWLVGSGPGRLPENKFPTIGSWLADLGLGIDWGGLGVYVAKGVTSGEPVRLTLRLDHRF
ncbi:MAG TPA: BamA/TamA family outer membrane protein [Gemmatimonadales bacterium]|nr:BamA/TamA family outer membrane protein [Gemmatimonadales bacterium]